MKENVIAIKSHNFAVRIVRMYQYLCNNKHEFNLSKQVLRCGTSIGANVHEAIQAQSRRDFISKMNIALKEASETEYWLKLLFDTGYLSYHQYKSINSDCRELNRILIAIVRNSAE